MAPTPKAKSSKPQETFQIDKIIAVRRKARTVEFHIVWELDGSKSWEPLAMFEGGLHNLAIRQFETKFPEEYAKIVKGKRKALTNADSSTPNKKRDTDSQDAPRSSSASQPLPAAMVPSPAVQNQAISQINQGLSSLGFQQQRATPDVVELFNEEHPSVVDVQAQSRFLRQCGKVVLLTNESDFIQYLFVLKQVNTWFYNVLAEPFKEVAKVISAAEKSIRSDALKSKLGIWSTSAYTNLLYLEGKRTVNPVEHSILLKLFYQKMKEYAEIIMSCEMKEDLVLYCSEFLRTIDHHESSGKPPAYVSLYDVAFHLSQMVNTLKSASAKERQNWC